MSCLKNGTFASQMDGPTYRKGLAGVGGVGGVGGVEGGGPAAVFIPCQHRLVVRNLLLFEYLATNTSGGELFRAD